MHTSWLLHGEWHIITTFLSDHYWNNLFPIEPLILCGIFIAYQGLSWQWLYGSWIYNYLCNQCLSPPMLWVRISIRARCTTLCDKVYQWLATGQWFSLGPPVSSTNKSDRHDITEILLKVTLNTIKQTNKHCSSIYFLAHLEQRSMWGIVISLHQLQAFHNSILPLWNYWSKWNQTNHVRNVTRVILNNLYDFCVYTPTRREGAILQSPCPSVRPLIRPFTLS